MKKKTNLIKHTGEKTNRQQFSCVSQIYWPWISCYWSSEHIPVHQKLPSQVKTLLKVQRTQVIEYFESFNTFSSKQKLQQTSAWFCLAKGWDIDRTTLTNPFSTLTSPYNHLEKSRYQFWQIHVTTLSNPTIWAKFNKRSDFSDKARECRLNGTKWKIRFMCPTHSRWNLLRAKKALPKTLRWLFLLLFSGCACTQY